MFKPPHEFREYARSTPSRAIRWAALAFGLVAAPIATATILTGPVVNLANGHTYYLLEQDTWTNSEAEAITLGGHLVTINDAAENQFVFDTFASFNSVDRNLWIGFNDVAVEGDFVWSSGDDLPPFHVPVLMRARG